MPASDPIHLTSDKVFSQDSLVENRRLNSALAAANIGSWEFEVATVQFWICERFKSNFNFSGNDTVSYDQMLELVYSDDRQKADQALQAVLKEGSDGILEIEVRIANSADGKTRWLQWKGQAYFNGQGEAYQLSGIIQDISGQVQSRQMLERSEGHLRALAENSPDMITRWDKDLSLVFANSVFEKIQVWLILVCYRKPLWKWASQSTCPAPTWKNYRKLSAQVCPGATTAGF